MLCKLKKINIIVIICICSTSIVWCRDRKKRMETSDFVKHVPRSSGAETNEKKPQLSRIKREIDLIQSSGILDSFNYTVLSHNKTVIFEISPSDTTDSKKIEELKNTLLQLVRNIGAFPNHTIAFRITQSTSISTATESTVQNHTISYNGTTNNIAQSTSTSTVTEATVQDPTIPYNGTTNNIAQSTSTSTATEATVQNPTIPYNGTTNNIETTKLTKLNDSTSAVTVSFVSIQATSIVGGITKTALPSTSQSTTPHLTTQEKTESNNATTAATTTTKTTTAKDSLLNGISDGAIVGIVVGSLFGLLSIFLIIYFYARFQSFRCSKKSAYDMKIDKYRAQTYDEAYHQNEQEEEV